MPRTDIRINSLLAATDIDVLPDTATIEDRGEYVVVRTPSNPNHYWGNFVLVREPIVVGGRARWEEAFDAEFADQPESTHVSIATDCINGDLDAAALEEFVAAGYDIDDAVALIASPHELVTHARANAEVEIRMLDPRPGMDAQLWRAAAELQVETRAPGYEEVSHRTFVERRLHDRRQRFVEGDGGWFVALTPEGEVAASCGIMVTEGRARYQAVDTAEAHRRRGVATRLVHDVGRAAVERFGAEQLVIGADANYHALPLYESLGFAVRERGVALCWWPTAPNAGLHPTRSTLARSAD